PATGWVHALSPVRPLPGGRVAALLPRRQLRDVHRRGLCRRPGAPRHDQEARPGVAVLIPCDVAILSASPADSRAPPELPHERDESAYLPFRPRQRAGLFHPAGVRWLERPGGGDALERRTSVTGGP